MNRLKSLLLISLFPIAAAFGADPFSMRVEVDAREISRKLLHARIEIPVSAGKTALWYPKWIPGTHAPGGPVQNVAGLRIESMDGKAWAWRRDDNEVYRIEVAIPDGVERIAVKLDYICNQPSVNSEGVDSFGDAELGVINWNTCLLYPENRTIDELKASIRLRLPAMWKFGTSLIPERQGGDGIEFKPETLRDLVDSPLICGVHFRTIDLKAKDMPPAYLHLVSESAEAIQIEDDYAAKFSTLLAQAGQLYGGAHFKEYHFLVTCSDQAGRVGLEHHSCSLDGVGERDLVDEKKRANWWVSTLMPHEFSHSWCGKHRRPAGMVTKNFHTPEQTSLLWVYEGLDEYLGEVLAVRSGLMSTNDYIPFLAVSVDELMNHPGRKWRSLEDTASASYLLRAGSPSWSLLRRDQDYYQEGRLLWLEADAIIRDRSDSRASLDDFNRKFLGTSHTNKIEPYGLDEIIRTLKECADYDWEGFFRERVSAPQESLPMGVVERLGFRLEYGPHRSAYFENLEKEFNYAGFYDSVGLMVVANGRVFVVPGGAADRAGMAPGMMIEGVNGRKFNLDRMRDAVADSVTRRQIELLILEGDSYRTIVVPYDGGPKYLELVRDPTKPDLLRRILAPREIP